MNKIFKNKLIIGLISAIAFTNAHASIIGGSVTVIAPPPAVFDTSYPTDILVGYAEQQGVSLTQDLSVDFLASSSAAGVVGTGTLINSYYFFVDPIDSPILATWTIEFDENVLAVVFSTDFLASSDYLGAVGTIYPGPFEKRGFEGMDFGYDITTLTSPTSLEFYLRSAAPGDWFRVITVSAVPVPPAVWLFGSGLLGLVGVARRK